MGYFKNLYFGQVQAPNTNIAVIDSKSVYQQPVNLFIEKAKNDFAKYNLKVKDSNGVKQFKGKSKIEKQTIYTMDEKPIFTLKNSNLSRKIIYLGKDKSKIIGKIKYRRSNVKYKIEITNLLTGQEEILEMNSDKKLVVCGIFHGKEKEGAPLIAKITRDPTMSSKCTLEIAPGVDNIFMIGLAAFFNERRYFGVGSKGTIKRKKLKRKLEPELELGFDYSGSEDDGDDQDDADAYNECGFDGFGNFDTYGNDGWGDSGGWCDGGGWGDGGGWCDGGGWGDGGGCDGGGGGD